MKICKYCGSENNDNQTTCESCGAKEFEQKCENCGKVFEGEFCPSCGVKAGQRARICPNCGKEYFSNACPDCGYIPPSRQPAANVFENQYIPPKRRTWLWVLGWIFIFPVPLTIILVRKENISTVLKIFLIILSWLAFFTLAYIGKTEEQVEQSSGETVTVSQQAVEETEPETIIEELE